MAIRPKPSNETMLTIPDRVEAAADFVDSRGLLNTIQTIGEAQGEAGRNDIIAKIKDFHAQSMGDTRQRFEAGRLGGLETARIIATIHDDILAAIYKFTTQFVIKSANPTTAERLAICAVGGYGRGEMAPGSDIDLLFLITDKKGSAYTESVIEYVLYLLWDLNFKLGHATRTIDQCIKLAKSDQTILSALLDLRFMHGDEPLAQDLYSTFRKSVTKGKGRKYIAEKLAERDDRHAAEGDSRYVIEPNIKEGVGGLRDLHVLYWIARFLDKDGRINDAQRAEDYVEMGLFDEQAATRFVRAADFLWRARIHLHFEAERPVETLSFDRQIVLARKMGYASGPVEVAVERFMKEYFTNAREVGALTRIACAKLEAERSMLLPMGLDSILPYSRRNMKKEKGFILDHGRLMFKDPMDLRHDPALIMKLFEIAGRRNLDIHPDAFSAINFRRNLIDNAFRRDPKIADIFYDVLLGAKAPYATLKRMNESGVLGRYLLEFGGIVARTQFNMHHAYTVDEHTLRLVRYFHDVESGEMADENPHLTRVVSRFTDRQRKCMYTACLLHDTGKGVGDQCIEGAKLARRAGRRLGLDKTVTDDVAWLVRHHLDMSETAQRRDISDQETIAEFAQIVGSQERLDMLYALTVVDIKSVGPGVWNDWKKVLLQGLYDNTTEHLAGHGDLEPQARANAAIEQLKDRLPEETAARIAPISRDLAPNYWNSFDMADLIRHARFFDSCIKDDIETAVHTRLDRPRDITEIWMLGRNRTGLFADICYAISAMGAQIVGAKLHTGHNGRVFNVFYLQNLNGLAFGRTNDELLDKLQSEVLQVLSGEACDLPVQPRLPSRRAAAIPVKNSAKIFDHSAPHVKILEIVARDRPRLLCDIADTLRDNDLDVLSAHIEVVGTQAFDAFYIRPIDPEISSDEKWTAKIKKAIKKALKETHGTKAA